MILAQRNRRSNIHQYITDGGINIDRSYFVSKHLSLSYKRTERRGRVVNTPASYLEGPGFKSLPRRPATLIEVFRGFSLSFQVNALSSYHRCYIV
jgi:hypothetical protein